MRISVLTIFPSLIECGLQEGIISRAQKRGLLRVDAVDIRRFAYDRHRVTDDYPYGGGQGMVMRPEPVFRALEYSLKRPLSRPAERPGERLILLTPQGRRLDHDLARDLSSSRHLVLICGRYEGIDDRVRSVVTDEISIGDYVLSGGELPALVIIDAVTRLIPGTVGDRRSVEDDSFAHGLLEGPQFTRPRTYRGLEVPSILLSGNHGAIREWRERQARKRTRQVRPDLLESRRAGPGTHSCGDHRSSRDC